ncbi:hypothetical protein [Hathewaya massiliensis]|uniref:hypothetical protein n=1 Tax=Hathewaya massiliensis TaxID=1964382 RepID=UPI00115B7DC2|nr:hypothetical protein [Hathewaya massiliensis]
MEEYLGTIIVEDIFEKEVINVIVQAESKEKAVGVIQEFIKEEIRDEDDLADVDIIQVEKMEKIRKI